jgi:hypothetical protein
MLDSDAMRDRPLSGSSTAALDNGNWAQSCCEDGK